MNVVAFTKKELLLLIFLICIVCFSYSQETYQIYKDSRYHFSFQYPPYWQIQPSADTNFYAVCIPVTREEKKIYDNCFDGIVFYMEVYAGSLDTTLLQLGYAKTGKGYTTSDRFSDSVKTYTMAGQGWKGIYHQNVCGVSCKDNGFHAATGACDYLFFSNDSITISIETTGSALRKAVFNNLTKSFRFD